MIETQLKIIVSDFCPPDQIFIADERALSTLFEQPLGVVEQVLEIVRPRKTVICPSEEVAEKIREAAFKVGCIRLESDGEPNFLTDPPDPL